MNPSSLYVHIPFCRHICAYCDFPKLFLREEWTALYLSALTKEIQSHGQGPYKTIYVGGGTPSCLNKTQLDELLGLLSSLLERGGEFSIECNPEDVDDELASLLVAHHVNRVSIGAQTSSPRLLKILGRHHDFGAVARAVSILKRAGITSSNVDWMYALPSQSDEELQNDIEAFLSLDVPHLSAYSLILEDATIFSHLGIKEASEDEQAKQYEMILSALRERGYERYEVSNFAKPGHQCRHNLVYWHDETYVGCGLGAAGYEGNTRYKNTRDFEAYCQGKFRAEEEEVGQEDDLHYFFLTNLRLAEGFALQTFEHRFGFSFTARYQETIEKLITRGLATLTDDRVYATDRGLLLLDEVLRALF